MSSLKNTLTGFAIAASTITSGQQVVKRITDTNNAVIVELFTLRNGTSLPTTVGDGGFDVGQSSTNGAISFANSTGSVLYGSNGGTPGGNPTILDETIGDGTFHTMQDNGIGIRTNRTDTNGSGSTLNIQVPTRTTHADAIEDNNTNIDLLKRTVSLPKSLADGSAIPLNTWAVIKSHQGVDIVTGNQIPPQKYLYFQWDGTTRSSRSQNRNNANASNLQSIGNNGQYLNTSESSSYPSHTKLYPNPTRDVIRFNDGDTKSGEKYNYQLINSATGQVIQSGQAIEDQDINIANKPAGVYILTTEDLQGDKSSKKVIKH